MIKRYKSGSRMSQAVTYNGFVFIAGQVADNRQGTLESQTREVLAKIEALLAKAGSDKSRLLAVDVFLPAIGDFDAMNRVYDACGPGQPAGARLRRGPPGRSRPARGNDRHRRAALSAAPSHSHAPPGGAAAPMHTGLFHEIDFDADGKTLSFLGTPYSVDRSPITRSRPRSAASAMARGRACCSWPATTATSTKARSRWVA